MTYTVAIKKDGKEILQGDIVEIPIQTDTLFSKHLGNHYTISKILNEEIEYDGRREDYTKIKTYGVVIKMIFRQESMN